MADRMRVLTFNIHKWRTMQDRPNLILLVDLFQAVKADVICLNEVLHPLPTSNGPALSWLADELGMTVTFGARQPKERSGDVTTGGSGNALLSRFPIKAVAWGLFSAIPETKQRGFLEVRLDVGMGRLCTVVGTHFDHTEERARLLQFADVVAWCQECGRWPDLILGDCNCIHPQDYEGRPTALAAVRMHPVAKHLANLPQGPQLAGRIEQAGYVDALIARGVLGGGTFLPAREPVRLDYIWLRSASAFHLTDAWIIQEPIGKEASDHRPVVADLQFDGGLPHSGRDDS
jgi:endonuclease/exonuclease/phosphatase family metal-dependent hydrolase